MSCFQKERILIRALKKARYARTLTFILSLTGRGNRNAGADGDLASSRCLRTAEKLVDCAQNFLNIREHPVVPESKHAVAPRIEKRGADFIFARPLGMLGAIEFDNEASFGRAEVSEVWPNRELTSKLGVAHLSASQMAPENSFRIGLFVPQAPRVSLR